MCLLEGGASRAAEQKSKATTESAETMESARRAFQEGNAEYSLGHFKEALGHFERAFKLRQAPALLFNIAQCHRQLREFDQAATTYRAFIRLDPSNTQVGLAQELLDQVELAMKVQNSAQHAPPLDVSGQDVVAAKPTPPPPMITQVPVAAVTPPPTPEAPRPRYVAWTTAGVGAATLVGASVVGLMSKSTASDMSNNMHSRAEADSLQSKLDSQSHTANLLFVAGGVLMVAAGALFVLHL